MLLLRLWYTTWQVYGGHLWVCTGTLFVLQNSDSHVWFKWVGVSCAVKWDRTTWEWPDSLQVFLMSHFDQCVCIWITSICIYSYMYELAFISSIFTREHSHMYTRWQWSKWPTVWHYTISVLLKTLSILYLLAFLNKKWWEIGFVPKHLNFHIRTFSFTLITLCVCVKDMQ